MTTLLENMKVSNSDINALSEEETKQYLTPFAFKMDKSLFGLPLASPAKRGIAILIDLSLIALLSDVTGVFLALAIAITFYYLGNKKRAQERGKKRGYKRRAIMRFIAALVLFVVLLDTLSSLVEYFGKEENEYQVKVEDNPISLTQSLTIGAMALSTLKTVADNDCQAFDCWKTQLDSVAADMANISYEGDFNITKTQLDDIFSDIGEEIDLPSNEQEQLISSMHDSYNTKLSNLLSENIEGSSKQSVAKISQLTQDEKPLSDQNSDPNSDVTFVSEDGETITGIDELKEEQKSNKPVYSLIEWVKGIIADLGLGFGWATFYFTAFTALWRGQTIGKKLLGIKVLQLDGTPLSLWDSFERYGGYGAGLATGLLGFIQIYWDPNKQAIHDRISATVVIDLNKARLSHNK